MPVNPSVKNLFLLVMLPCSLTQKIEGRSLNESKLKRYFAEIAEQAMGVWVYAH